MKYFSKEREERIKESLIDIFKRRDKPIDTSLMKKYYKRYINLLKTSKKDCTDEYFERLHREVSMTSNARFIVNGNVESARPEVVNGELVATEVYIIGKAIDYGYRPNITSLGFLELVDGEEKEYYIEVDRLLDYTINKSTLENFVEKNPFPKEILEKELPYLLHNEGTGENEKVLKSIDDEYYVE